MKSSTKRQSSNNGPIGRSSLSLETNPINASGVNGPMSAGPSLGSAPSPVTSTPPASRTLGFLSGWRRSLGPGSGSGGSSANTSPLRTSSTNIDDGASDGSNKPPAGLFEEPTAIIFQNGSATPSTIGTGGYNSDEDISQFILARIEEQNKGERSISSFEAFTSQLRASFASVRDSMAGSAAANPGGEADAAEDIDWDFWGKVMNNYEEIARRQPRLLTKKLQQGIPDAIRGMVWQLMSKGKSLELEATYRTLLTRTSSHEKQIQRDLSRTFPKHEHFSVVGGVGQESLFNVIKAYSLYDPEVGYCQGIAFIAGPLLLNQMLLRHNKTNLNECFDKMPDEEAFCVLVKLMKAYNFRELYTQSMAGLHLRLYQFDRLLEEMFPVVAKHLEAQDIKSTMYASQWFMTMFAYRFPLEIVFRIMDIVFAEGIEAMFRFSFALLKRNQDVILSLDFEPLLDFLKVGLFDIYINNVNALISNAASVHISKSRLDRLALEHAEELKKNDPEFLAAEELRGENRRLQESLRKLEAGYEVLNQEHIDLAKEHLEVKAGAERSMMKIEELQEKVDGLKSVLSSERSQAEAEVKEEMDRLARKNLELTKQNAELQDTVDRLESLLAAKLDRLQQVEIEREELQTKWDGLKAALR
ncbi:GTPase-activating protein [Blyttiomyces sp. JEL0837]|nr:GTPase-activating protein [Blyttiomyces sp. JEL0837]